MNSRASSIWACSILETCNVHDSPLCHTIRPGNASLALMAWLLMNPKAGRCLVSLKAKVLVCVPQEADTIFQAGINQGKDQMNRIVVSRIFSYNVMSMQFSVVTTAEQRRRTEKGEGRG